MLFRLAGCPGWLTAQSGTPTARSGAGDGIVVVGGGSGGGGGGSVAAVDHELKFECQMYKVRDDEYLVDVQVWYMWHMFAWCVTGW
jgi:hypothetical protein